MEAKIEVMITKDGEAKTFGLIVEDINNPLTRKHGVRVLSEFLEAQSREAKQVQG